MTKFLKAHKTKPMRNLLYDKAMKEMECWSAQNHLKNCKKCALQARQEGIVMAIEAIEKMDNKYHAGYICVEEAKISELKEK